MQTDLSGVVFVCSGPNQPRAKPLQEILPLLRMKTRTRRRVGRFVKGPERVGDEMEPGLHTTFSLSLCPASALSGEKRQEAGEDGGPAGQKRRAEEAPQSSGAASSLRFTFVHFEMLLWAPAADCCSSGLFHVSSVAPLLRKPDVPGC